MLLDKTPLETFHCHVINHKGSFRIPAGIRLASWLFTTLEQGGEFGSIKDKST